MSATNQTANYSLNQWSETDPVSRRDFNDDNLAVDTALGSLAALAAQKAGLASGTYFGTGTYGAADPSRLELPFAPKLLLLLDERLSGPHMTVIIPGVWSYALSTYGYTASTASNVLDAACTHRMRTALEGTTVSWHSNVSALAQMNEQGATYHYVAIG